MPAVEEYLKPEVVRSVARLDLRARFIVEGFLSGLHASPFHGFSVEFSEHRRYAQGDDPKLIDWLVFLWHQRIAVGRPPRMISGVVTSDRRGPIPARVFRVWCFDSKEPSSAVSIGRFSAVVV